LLRARRAGYNAFNSPGDVLLLNQSTNAATARVTLRCLAPTVSVMVNGPNKVAEPVKIPR
jgi:hypothetical protein